MTEALVARCTKTLKHDGQKYQVVVENLVARSCAACGEVEYTEAALDRFYDALRSMLNLLSPDEIKRLRKAANKTQAEVAADLQIAKETISRWESGAILPSRGYNAMLRTYFEGLERSSAASATTMASPIDTVLIAPMAEWTAETGVGIATATAQQWIGRLDALLTKPTPGLSSGTTSPLLTADLVAANNGYALAA